MWPVKSRMVHNYEFEVSEAIKGASRFPAALLRAQVLLAPPYEAPSLCA
jgi:hypothetical protein